MRKEINDLTKPYKLTKKVINILSQNCNNVKLCSIVQCNLVGGQMRPTTDTRSIVQRQK